MSEYYFHSISWFEKDWIACIDKILYTCDINNGKIEVQIAVHHFYTNFMKNAKVGL